MRVELSEREAATVMAALRNWQVDALNEDLEDAFAGYFEHHRPLTDDEVDELYQRLDPALSHAEGAGAAVTPAAP